MEEVIREVVSEKRVIVAGHSFGGATCVEVTRRNVEKRIVGCLSYEPWLFSVEEKVRAKSYEIKVPTLVVNSESWHLDIQNEFDSPGAVANLVSSIKAPVLEYQVYGSLHSHMNDSFMLFPLILAPNFKTISSKKFAEEQGELMAKMGVDFLCQAKILPNKPVFSKIMKKLDF
jgi:hypothetical protein